MESQYDQAYKAPPSRPAQGHSTWNTIPVVLTVDSYNIGQDNRNKYTINFASAPARDAAGAEIPTPSSIHTGIGALRDVVSIELIQASIPVNGADLYVIVNVNGYSRVKSNNNNAQNSFCTIPCQNPGVDVFHNMRRTGSLPDDNYIYYFPEPARLNKLEIELVSPTGIPIVYNDNHVLTFEIKTLNRAPKTEARYQNGVRGPW
jgi:hypothetical protein